MNKEGDVRMDSTPKNIRQMGESEERIKAYMEDYVNTYLKKLQEERDNTEEAEKSGAIGVLVGHTEMAGEIPRIFINGAIELHPSKKENGMPDFTREVWTSAYDLQQQYFPGQDLCGIFACEGICRRFSKKMLFQLVRENFADCDQAMLYLLTDEGEECFYRIAGKREERLSGYYCYYERNEAMQDYMMDNLRPRSVENEAVQLRQRPESIAADPVESYREHMRKEQERPREDGRSGRAVYALCAVMVGIVFLGGAFLMKRRQEGITVSELLSRLHIPKEEAVEANASAEADILPEGGRTAGETDYERIVSHADGIVVEEIPGNIGGAASGAEETAAGPGGSTDGAEIAGSEETASSGAEVSGNGETASGSAEVSGNGDASGNEETSGSGETASGNVEETNSGETAGSGETASVDTSDEPSAVQASTMTGIVYVVQAGDSLSSISRRFYGTDAFVRTIQELNQLSDADLIQAGQVLVLP